MAVVIDFDEKKNAIFRSINGLDVSPQEVENAKKLDSLLQKEMKKLSKRIPTIKKGSKVGSRRKVNLYWEFGIVLRKIFFDSQLVNPLEKNLFWSNVELHASDELLAKNRGPNRIHVAYCFRLAGYPKEIAQRRRWGEWVYLFDSPFVNKESRFDGWDKLMIKSDSIFVTRVGMRLFTQCLNSMMKEIETQDLTDSELFNCYDAAWSLASKILEVVEDVNNREFKNRLKQTILVQRQKVGIVMEGSISATDYGSEIIELLSLD